MTKPFTAREIVKSIVIGVLKGLLYYVIINIAIMWFIIKYLMPLIISSIQAETIFSSIIDYQYINYVVLILYVLFAITSTVLSRHVPYGSAISNLLTIAYIYVAIYSIENIEYKYVYNEYSELIVNISPLLNTILYLVIVISIANSLYALAREYRKRR